MKQLLSFILTLLVLSFCAQSNKISVSASTPDAKVPRDKTKLTISVYDYNNPNEIDSMKLSISVNPFDENSSSESHNYTLSKNKPVTLTLPIGNYKITTNKPCSLNSREQFKFEVTKGGGVVSIWINLTPKQKKRKKPKYGQIQPKKPIIYAYTDKDIDVSFKLKTDAKLTFTYPTYKDQWNTKVLASGGFEVNGSKYPYLFWEGEMDLKKHISTVKEGFIISKDSVTSFLENQLNKIGLNSTEKTDFITYWAPQMIEANQYYIKFLIDEEYNKHISSLICSVQPDTEIRVFMIFSPNPEFQNPTPQTFTSHKRTGFTVVEWGGSIVTADLLNL